MVVGTSFLGFAEIMRMSAKQRWDLVRGSTSSPRWAGIRAGKPWTLVVEEPVLVRS